MVRGIWFSKVVTEKEIVSTEKKKMLSEYSQRGSGLPVPGHAGLCLQIGAIKLLGCKLERLGSVRKAMIIEERKKELYS